MCILWKDSCHCFLSLFVHCTFIKTLQQLLNLIWNLRLQAFVFNCNWTSYTWLLCQYFGIVLNQCWGTGALTKKWDELAYFIFCRLKCYYFLFALFFVCLLHLEWGSVQISYYLPPEVWNSSLFRPYKSAQKFFEHIVMNEYYILHYFIWNIR